MKALPDNKPAVSDVVVRDVEAIEVNTDASAYARIGWLIILAGFGGFLLWAFFAPLDKGVPLNGTVMVATNRKPIQYQSGGTIDEILVTEGAEVKKDQVLVRMNSVQIKSALDITRVQYAAARLAEARLDAERDGKSSVTFPATLNDMKNDPRVIDNMALQQQLFNSRRQALQDELAAMDESIAGLKVQAEGLSQSRDSKQEQIVILKDQLSNLRDLTKDGYVPRSRLQDLERTYAQISGALSEDIGNIGRTRRQMAETSLRRSQRTQEFQRDVRSQLSDTQRDIGQLQAKMEAQQFDLDHSEIRAPVDGTVLGINVFAQGAVVAPGSRIMDIVPSDDPLVVEGELPVNLIDKVHNGLKVELIFSAFNVNKTPHIPGVVVEVAADRTVDERTKEAFYKVRAKVAPEGMKLVSKLQLRPGMPVQMFIRTGERSMMNYLLKPVFDRSKNALTED